MASIARWTTPSITYKPSAVEIDNITDIYLVIRQSGRVLITKDKDNAFIDENGFMWTLTQEDTALIEAKTNAIVQVDYKTESGMRYTTVPKQFTISDSAIQEVI